MDEEEQGLGFARRYRPSRFEDYIGNAKMKQTIFRRLRMASEGQGAWPQTIELTGKTGCGKTTMSRIIIREYMCENRDPVLGACGECYSCQSLDAYIRTGDTSDVYDIIEIDAADRSRKGDMKQITDEMNIPPMGTWKVYYFDEFHIASTEAQSQLLKSIEEPPPGVLIIIASTDPEKILDSIRNRMQLKLRVERPSTKELVAHLATICKNEGLPYDNEGLRIVANRANMVIRDSLNTLEQVLTNQKSAQSEAVVEEFDEINDSTMFDFIESYLDRDYLTYSSLLYSISTTRSLETFLSNFRSFVMRGIYIGNNVDVEGLTTAEIVKYRDVFSRFEPADLAILLANLKKISTGDLEANFLALIYLNGDFDRPTGTVSTPEVTATEAQAAENKARNSNLSALRGAQADRSKDAALSTLDRIKESDFLAMVGAHRTG